jgi:gliding motility-associated-like protein
MRKILYLIVIVLFQISNKIIAQNDCVDAIFVCGNTNLYGLETIGFGTQEISYLNACSSQENNSIWLKIKIKNGGTLGFTITPESSNLVEDFDFWIYGPNVTCTNLGTAIRCSTTNPLQANLSYNTTGLNETETDVSEGPGFDGNSFVKWLTVLDNETYYIAIDRPVGDSNFSIVWNGTATFYDTPTIQNSNSLAINNCSIDDSQPDRSIFDLSQNTALAIGNQTNIVATYYTNINNAITNTNPILNTTSFQNNSNPQTIYIRLTNSVTQCFDVGTFELNVLQDIIPNLNFKYDSPICVEGFPVSPEIPTNFTIGGQYSATPNGLSINTETGVIDLTNSAIGDYIITYTLNQNSGICYTFYENYFNLTINFCEIPKGVSPNNDGKNDTFNLENFDVEKASIFNRYGIEIFSKLNYTNEWKGQDKNNKSLPDGTYYYIVKLRNGETRTGWVYLSNEN